MIISWATLLSMNCFSTHKLKYWSITNHLDRLQRFFFCYKTSALLTFSIGFKKAFFF